MVEIEEKDKPWWKYCLNCGAPIPKLKYDSLGRRNTRTSSYCDNNQKCRNQFLISKDPAKQKKYMYDYYRKNPDKFIKKVKVEN